MASGRGRKGEAEEAMWIKEGFVSISVEVSQENHEERARELHVLGGRKGGEERIIETL